jgi:flagellar biosynthesis protein FlhF
VEVEEEEAVAAHAEALETAAALPAFDQQYHQGLIRRLRNAPPADAAAAQSRNFNRAELLTILRGHRAPDALAPALAEAAEKTGMSDMTLALASALDQRMKTRPIELAKASALLLTGPHGSGKTALAAKLAASAQASGRAVKLIAGDAKGAGAVERLKTFAEHLEAGFGVAEDAAALANQIGECAKDGVLAIIDTAGFDPRNGKARSAYAALTKIAGVEAIGVVSASGDAEELSEIVHALTSLGARRLVVTGLDMARRLGTLAAAAMATPALAHVTRSPFLGSGLETLTPLSLARALIERNTPARKDAANPETRSAS